MNVEETQKQLRRYFEEKLEVHGATPQGVDYNGPEAQHVRFEQLVKVIDPAASRFSVIDYGCGYGAMFDFLHRTGRTFEYYGIDVIDKMVLAAREAHRGFPNARFTTDEGDAPVVDYLLASAIFNIKLQASAEAWQEFTLDTLRRMNALCSTGFSFNLLTNYSDDDRMRERPDLYFGDPLLYFDYCKREFSRDVALLHDYGLYDFTILVRKGG